jgi:hypothetical protein
MGEMRYAYNITFRKSEGKGSLDRPWCGWDDNGAL